MIVLSQTTWKLKFQFQFQMRADRNYWTPQVLGADEKGNQL